MKSENEISYPGARKAPNGKRLGNFGAGLVGAGSCEGGQAGGGGNGGCGCSYGGGVGGGKRLGPNSSPIEFLQAGSPQLALAKARNAMFVPWTITLKTELVNTGAGTVTPDITTKQRITRHCVVESIAMRVLNESTANASLLSPQADWFNNSQLGLEAQLNVDPAGVGYPICDQFTDLSILAPPDPRMTPLSGWILTDEQAITMSISQSIALPVAPMRLTLAIVVWNPYGRFWDRLDPYVAAQCLWDEFGIDCGEVYIASCICAR